MEKNKTNGNFFALVAYSRMIRRLKGHEFLNQLGSPQKGGEIERV